MKITLYSTSNIESIELEKALRGKSLKYEKVADIETMQNKGFMSAPMLEVDGEVMNYINGRKWISEI